jgi:hypothetical protein
MAFKTSILTMWSKVLLEKLIITEVDKKFSHLLWCPMVYYCLYQTLPLDVSYPEPIEHIPDSHMPFFKIHFNITIPSMARSPKWSLSIHIFWLNI